MYCGCKTPPWNLSKNYKRHRKIKGREQAGKRPGIARGKTEEETEKASENIVTEAGVDKVWEREAPLPGNNKEN